MQRFDQVAIVGVGLIGSSIGLGLAQRGLARRIVGIGRRAETLQIARERGAVTDVTTDLAAGVAEAQLVVVATPVAKIVESVAQVAAACPADCLITDAGSTKAEIIAALAQSLPASTRFVGSHPLAGSEQAGPAHGRADLLVGRVVVVTPTTATRPEDQTRLTEFWKSLGARVVEMTPADHDAALAVTSHLPHLVAAAIAASTPEQYAALVATGWLDTTRIAAGDPELWRQIFQGNRQNVLRALDAFEQSLAALRATLEGDQPDQLQSYLSQAKRTRDALGS